MAPAGGPNRSDAAVYVPERHGRGGRPVGSAEAARLAAVRRYEPHASGRDDDLDGIVRLAAALCGTPMAAVSIVGADGELFVARAGLDRITRAQLDDFGALTVSQRDVLEIPDALADPRFKHSPLVNGRTRIRFYAGAPLVTPDGQAIGTVCVMDRTARRLDEGQRAALRTLADQSVALVVLRERLADAEATMAAGEAARAELEERQERYRTIVDSANDGIWFVDQSDTIAFVNRRMAEMLGATADEIIGLPVATFVEVFLAEGHEAGPDEVALRGRNGDTVWVHISASSHRNRDGTYGGTLGMATDITETRRVSELLRAREVRFRALVENSLDVIAVVDADIRLVYVSPSAEQILGYRPAELLAMDMETYIGGVENWSALIADVVLGPGETSPLRELQVRHRSGALRHVVVRATNLLDDPAVGGIVVNIRDISDQKFAQHELERTRAHAISVLDTANDAYLQIDASGHVTEWNRQAERMFGWNRRDAVGRAMEELVVPPEHVGVYRRELRIASRRAFTHGHIVDSREFTARRRDGSVFPVEFTVWVTHVDDGMRFNWFIRDITERKALQDQLSQQALHDELTGLPNRNLLWDSLEGAIGRADRNRDHVGVLFCDLDQFKVINDSLGHTVGDELLRSVARRLERSTRTGDTVGRFGGDEFVIVFDGVAGEHEASALGERVLGAFRSPFEVDDAELFITASIGIAVGSASADAENLLRDADAAMYRAKEKGRARLELFDRTLRLRAKERHNSEQALRRALERNEFRVLYQPVVSLAEGRVVGAEALVRWQRPGRGLIGPAEFIALAEDSGLILPLGAWVIETACRQLQAWGSALPERRLSMSVNLSARQLASPTLVKEVARVLAETGCSPAAVTLELTETVLMGDVEASAATLDDLKSLGVQIAIDDFGTGYSSLAYLKRFPIDTLKIDKSFIDNLGADPYDSAIVAAITTMGTILGQTIVAEGVETSAHARLVKAHGCAFAQGHYFSTPLSGEGFLRILRSGARYTWMS
jgi:diguanylate cyclase (GGDEF)-like protein/PAS domain S-box-containing protein